MSYCTYWLGQGTGCCHIHWLPGHFSAASHWLPRGEWEESSPHPLPVAERVNVKTLSLPIIWVTLGFRVCLRVCVCVSEGVYVGGRKEIKRERESEGEASSVSSPPFSLPVSLLLVTPSFLPSPGPPCSPAWSRTETPLPPRPPRDPLTLLTSPSHQPQPLSR